MAQPPMTCPLGIPIGLNTRLEHYPHHRFSLGRSNIVEDARQEELQWLPRSPIYIIVWN